MITKMAGLTDEKALLSSFERHINTLENNPGRKNQSLAQYRLQRQHEINASQAAILKSWLRE